MTRVAVDGIDCAGKTTLADQLAALLKAERICLDDFLRPPQERYARGEESPEGYYRDSFDYDAFRAAVLSAPQPLVADGVFLQRPDLRIWIDTPFDEALERALTRDAGRFADVRERYERRYFPGQRLYLDEVDPRARADIVVAS